MSESVFFDSHAHITSEELYSDIDDIIERALEADVKKIININTDKITFERGLALAEKYPGIIYNSVATTPHDVEELGEKEFSYFESKLGHQSIIAIGETGLDYFYEHSNRELQQQFLKRYAQLAKQKELPLIIHCRGDGAFDDLVKILTPFKLSRVLLHCFTLTLEDAQLAIEKGWFISISGIVTFPKSVELQNVVAKIGCSRLLIETDAPYLAPMSKRGKKNEPSNVVETCAKIASLLDLSLDQVATKTFENSLSFFQIKDSKILI